MIRFRMVPPRNKQQREQHGIGFKVTSCRLGELFIDRRRTVVFRMSQTEVQAHVHLDAMTRHFRAFPAAGARFHDTTEAVVDLWG